MIVLILKSVLKNVILDLVEYSMFWYDVLNVSFVCDKYVFFFYELLLKSFCLLGKLIFVYWINYGFFLR